MSKISNTKNKSSTNHVTRIEIIGIMNTMAFQKAKWCALILHDRLPWTFPLPKIHEMFQIEWRKYLKDARRNFGGRMWLIDRPVAVFIEDNYFGSDIDFIDYINENFVISIPIIPKFYEKLIVNSLKKAMKKSKFVYFTFAIDGMLIGSLLFMLYSDLLPRTCEYFLNLCVESGTKLSEKKKLNYKNSLIHRIVANRWLQLGDIGTGDSIENTTPDESYSIAHDRCGVLSLSNNGTHRNGPQFIVCLNPNPWMDGNYIAFGQLVDGAGTLEKICDIPTHYESPTRKIVISQCGVYCLCAQPELEVPDTCVDYANSFGEGVGDEAEALDTPYQTA